MKTFQDLEAKGFKELRFIEATALPLLETVIIESWGQTFTGLGDFIDDAANDAWNQFCDFINGRS